MGTTLTGTTPQDTYDSLIKVTDNGPLSGTAKYLSDGLGNDSALALSTGNIGIGTTSPSRNLHILGGAGVGTVLKLEAGSGAITYLQLAYNGATNAQSGYISYDSSANMGLFTNDTERMRITSAGNVGIGTSNPTAKLNVVHTASTTAPALKIESSGTLANNDILRVQINGVTNGFRIFQNASSELVYSFIDGQMGIGNAAPAVPLDVVGNIRSSTGILFGSDTAAANLLDDYEEGTWTMGISFGGASVGATFSNNTGTYTKIGRQVTVNGLLQFTNKGSSTGTALLTGLPFTIPASVSNYAAASIWCNNVSFAGQFASIGTVSTTRVELWDISSAGVIIALNNTNFANNSEVMISFTYFV